MESSDHHWGTGDLTNLGWSGCRRLLIGIHLLCWESNPVSFVPRNPEFDHFPQGNVWFDTAMRETCNFLTGGWYQQENCTMLDSQLLTWKSALWSKMLRYFLDSHIYIYICLYVYMAASQNVKPRSIPWTHRPIHTPDPYQNAGDPDRSIRLDHCGPIHTRILTQTHIYIYI